MLKWLRVADKRAIVETQTPATIRALRPRDRGSKAFISAEVFIE